eukprot:COSAG02_NODE_5407_length_4354_cov_7.370623_1_plen_303_part_00
MLKLGRDVPRRIVAGDLSRLMDRGSRHSSRLSRRLELRVPRRWSSQGRSSVGPQQQLIVTQAELEAAVERAVERIAKDVARNTARIKAQGELVAANTESRLTTERRLWNEAAMEDKIERVHDVLVREEARLQQWLDLGITGIKTRQWDRYSIGVAVAIVAGVMTLAAEFKKEIYDKIGKEAAELTGAAISDPNLQKRVQQLLTDIGKDEETVKALAGLLQQIDLKTLLVENVLKSPAVRHAAGDLITGPEVQAAVRLLVQQQIDELLQDEKTHHTAAVALKSTLGRTLWFNREPLSADDERS